MQSETADFDPSVATMRSQPNNMSDVQLVLQPGKLDETYAPPLILTYSCIIWKHNIIHKTESTLTHHIAG